MRTAGPWHVAHYGGRAATPPPATVLGVNPRDATLPPVVARDIANRHDLALILYAPAMYDVIINLTHGPTPHALDEAEDVLDAIHAAMGR